MPIQETKYKSTWKIRLAEIDASIARRNISDEHNEKRYYKDDEIGFIHQKNKSCVRVADDGDIDLFSDSTVGIKIDKETGSIYTFGNTTGIITRGLNMYTTPTGLSWNGYYFNPTLYSKTGNGIPYEDKNIRLSVVFDRWDEEEGEYVSVHTEMPFYVRKPVKTIYNEEINQLLRDLNIPL